MSGSGRKGGRRDRGSAEVVAVLVVACLAAAVFLAPAPQAAGEGFDELRTRGLGDYRVEDLKFVYHGRPPLTYRPCVVRSDAVYALIPEYQQIRAGGLSNNKPRYHFLMQKASRRFVRAVKAMARRYGHDTVVEAGYIVAVAPGAETPPDRTSETISALQR